MKRQPTVPVTRVIDGAEIEYLLRTSGPRLAVLFHGGHLRADLAIGQESFSDAGWSLLHPSRPGYGGTPLKAGPDDAAFVDRIALLCAQLGYQDVVSIGISAGGRTAMTFAARHPDIVSGLVLEGSVSFLPWPARWTRTGATVLFRPTVERVTWGVTRLFFGLFPDIMLWGMLTTLSTLPAHTALRALSEADRAQLVALFTRMRSGRGFLNDLREPIDVTKSIHQPTLIVASRHDGAVGQEHPLALVDQIVDATLVMTDSVSHLLWIGPHAEQERDAVAAFLATLPPVVRPR